jgi:hypothetical protein
MACIRGIRHRSIAAVDSGPLAMVGLVTLTGPILATISAGYG